MQLSPGEHTAEVNGLRLRYKVAGNEAALPLIVQSPGWGLGSAIYEQTLRPLEDDFTVIYYDTRGSGGSEAPENSEDINVGAMVEDLEELRKHIGLSSFALFGHSHGGLIALNYALRYQEHISKFILANAMLGMEEFISDLQRTLPELAKQERFIEAVKAFGEYPLLTTDEEFGECLQKILPLYFYDPDNGIDIADQLKKHSFSIKTSRATDASNGNFAVRDALCKINIPTLVIAGRHDFAITPEQELILHEGIKGSRFVVLEQSGHWPWLEEPEAFFTEVKNFIL